jgi:hypothetical protein
MKAGEMLAERIACSEVFCTIPLTMLNPGAAPSLSEAMIEACPSTEIGRIANPENEEFFTYLRYVTGLSEIDKNIFRKGDLYSEINRLSEEYREVLNLRKFYEWEESLSKFHDISNNGSIGDTAHIAVRPSFTSLFDFEYNEWMEYLRRVLGRSSIDKGFKCPAGFKKVRISVQEVKRMFDSISDGRFNKDFGGTLRFYQSQGYFDDYGPIDNENVEEMAARCMRIKSMKNFMLMCLDGEEFMKPVYFADNILTAFISDAIYHSFLNRYGNKIKVELLDSDYGESMCVAENQDILDKLLKETMPIKIKILFGDGDKPAVLRGNYVAYVAGNFCVTAEDEGVVFAEGSSTVYAEDMVKVFASDEASVRAYHNSVVQASGAATVRGWGNSRIVAESNASVIADDCCTVKASGKSRVVADGKSTVWVGGGAKLIAGQDVFFVADGDAEITLSDNCKGIVSSKYVKCNIMKGNPTFL